MSPLMIEMLLHYFCCVDDYRKVGQHLSAVDGAIAQFLGEDLLVPQEGCEAKYRITDRGRAYCEAMQKLPLPVFMPGYWYIS